MPQKYTESRKNSNRAWDAKNLDRISIAAPKGTRDALKLAADQAGKSVNQFIIDTLRPAWESTLGQSAAPDQQQTPEAD